jgi:beta-lactamase superfamily II metal-dependent hydrolase
MGFEIDVLGCGDGCKGGDAIVFRYGNLMSDPISQRIVVVDGGYTANGEEIYRLITDKYKSKNIYLAILTHPDLDHVQGLKRLFEYNDLKITNLIMHRPWLNEAIINANYTDGRITNNSIKERLKKTFSYAYELSELAEKKGTTIIEPSIVDYSLDFGANLYILGPCDSWYKTKLLESDKTPDCVASDSKFVAFSASDEYENYTPGQSVKWYYDDPHTTPINETSVVCLFEYNGIKVLFTGDVGREGLKLAVENANSKSLSLKDLMIFFSPHHGSRKNLTPELMDAIKSTFTFLSTPPEGDPHHPSRRLVNKYKEKGHTLYSTNGQSMHWGVECPNRNATSKTELSYFKTMEKSSQ